MSTIRGHKVVAGAITFNEAVSYPSGALKFCIDQLDGWDDTAELESQSSMIGGTTDGEEAGSFFPFRARHLLLGGYVYAGSALGAESLKDVIYRDAFSRNVDVVLTRYEAVPKWMTVRVSDKKEVMWHRDGFGFRFTVPLMAPDPFKYALNPLTVGPVGVAGLSTGGRSYPRTYPLEYSSVDGGSPNAVYINNTGTADTSPVVTINGPLVSGAWRLINETNGGDIRFGVGLAVDDTLVIDFKHGTAYLNGYPVTATITGDFWKINPGINTIRLYADYDPAASMTVVAYPAWE